MGGKTCTVEGCLELHLARGFCRRHYGQLQRGGTPTLERGGQQYTDEVAACAAPGCSNEFPQRARGARRIYCSRLCRDRVEKARSRARPDYVPVHRRPDRDPCSVVGCDRPRFVHGMCPMHAERVRKYGTAGEAEARKAPAGQGKWRLTSEGYLRRSRHGHIELQHRVVMEEHLGRPLWPDENVHHRNGQRADNRIENLELWSKAQPAGQSVEDKTVWAIEFLNRYGYRVEGPVSST